MDCSLPDSSVHGILQARILEWGYSLLQGIFLTQGSNSGLLNRRQILCHLGHQEALFQLKKKKTYYNSWHWGYSSNEKGKILILKECTFYGLYILGILSPFYR